MCWGIIIYCYLLLDFLFFYFCLFVLVFMLCCFLWFRWFICLWWILCMWNILILRVFCLLFSFRKLMLKFLFGGVVRCLSGCEVVYGWFWCLEGYYYGICMFGWIGVVIFSWDYCWYRCRCSWIWWDLEICRE